MSKVQEEHAGMEKGPATLGSLESAVVHTLLYFDIFTYPLTEAEICNCLPLPARPADVKQAIQGLADRGLISREGEFYQLTDAPERIERRKKGNALAAKRLVKARKVARFIGGFPFVRAVMASGSLSKGYMEPESDLDFFIVTEPGRLWVARTLLIIYKKIFLFNSHKNFCVNYFIDTDNLGIEDRNVFTATECVYLLPLYGPGVYDDFLKSNDWTGEWYPNYPARDIAACHLPHRPLRKRMGEYLLKGRLGEWFDNWCLRRTLRRWNRRFGHMDVARFEVALRSRKYVSKHHPSDFQHRVLDKICKGKNDFEARHGVQLSPIHEQSPVHA